MSNRAFTVHDRRTMKYDQSLGSGTSVILVQSFLGTLNPGYCKYCNCFQIFIKRSRTHLSYFLLQRAHKSGVFVQKYKKMGDDVIFEK